MKTVALPVPKGGLRICPFFIKLLMTLTDISVYDNGRTASKESHSLASR
jgi:hypothetical protein